MSLGIGKLLSILWKLRNIRSAIQRDGFWKALMEPDVRKGIIGILGIILVSYGWIEQTAIDNLLKGIGDGMDLNHLLTEGNIAASIITLILAGVTALTTGKFLKWKRIAQDIYALAVEVHEDYKDKQITPEESTRIIEKLKHIKDEYEGKIIDSNNGNVPAK